MDCRRRAKHSQTVGMSRMERSGAYTPEQIASFYKFQVVPDKGYLQRIREGEK